MGEKKKLQSRDCKSEICNSSTAEARQHTIDIFSGFHLHEVFSLHKFMSKSRHELASANHTE